MVDEYRPQVVMTVKWYSKFLKTLWEKKKKKKAEKTLHHMVSTFNVPANKAF